MLDTLSHSHCELVKCFSQLELCDTATTCNGEVASAVEWPGNDASSKLPFSAAALLEVLCN